MADEIPAGEQSIRDSLETNIRTTTVDGNTVTTHSLKDAIEADRYFTAKDADRAAAKRRRLPFRFGRYVMRSLR